MRSKVINPATAKLPVAKSSVALKDMASSEGIDNRQGSDAQMLDGAPSSSSSKAAATPLAEIRIDVRGTQTVRVRSRTA